MKPPSKNFSIQLIVSLIALILISVALEGFVSGEEGDQDNLTLIYSGALVSTFLAVIGGWNNWKLKSTLIISFIVGGVPSGALIYALLFLIWPLILYTVFRKARFYYTYFATKYIDDRSLDAETKS